MFETLRSAGRRSRSGDPRPGSVSGAAFDLEGWLAARIAERFARAEASAFLAQFGIRLKPQTLARIWSTGGDGPPCRHIRGKPFYPRGVLRNWARSQVGDLRVAAPPAAQARRHG